MKRNLILREDRGETTADNDFLDHLRERMEDTLLADASDVKKITIGDYLKLVALQEERRRAQVPASEEVVVRWQDPPEQTEKSEDRNT